MRGKLSSSERRYRIKLIQEKHYDKKRQKQLDVFVDGKKGIYKEIYKAYRNKEPHFFFCIIGLGAVIGALGDFTKALNNTKKVFR